MLDTEVVASRMAELKRDCHYCTRGCALRHERDGWCAKYFLVASDPNEVESREDIVKRERRNAATRARRHRKAVRVLRKKALARRP